jgi:hypothetical protein
LVLSLDAHAGVDRTLGGHLVGGALAQEPTLADVGAFGVLAYDDDVDALVRIDERPLVDVEVEFEAHLEQQSPLDHARRDAGGPDGAEQQRVQRAPLVEHAVGKDRAVTQIAVASQVVVHRPEGDTGGPDDLEGLGDDLGADAVPADDSDLVAHCFSEGADPGR